MNTRDVIMCIDYVWTSEIEKQEKIESLELWYSNLALILRNCSVSKAEFKVLYDYFINNMEAHSETSEVLLVLVIQTFRKICQQVFISYKGSEMPVEGLARIKQFLKWLMKVAEKSSVENAELRS